MKRKIFSVLLVLALVLGFSLVTALPAAASPGTLNVRPYTLQTGTNAASWSDVQKGTGSYSVLLDYASGDNSYVQFTPLTGTTVDDMAAISDGWSWWYYTDAANGPLMELRFTSADNVDPDGAGHVDVTVNTAEASPTLSSGTTEEVTSASTCIYFGNDPTDGTSFYDNTGSVTLAGVLAAINAEPEMTAGSDTATAWELTRVRLEIGWVGSARTCYIDDIEVNGTTYYGMIDDAVDSASASDTITVYPGTYVEDISVGTASLTLESTAGKATTFIEGAMTLNSDADNFVLGGATGKGFTLQEAAVLIALTGPTDVEISYNTLDTGDGTTAGDAIRIWNAALTSGLTVTQNTFLVTDQYDMGVRGHLSGPVAGLTVSNNTFTGTDNTLETSAVEINELDISSTGSTISGNTITSVGNGVVIGSDSGGGLVCGTGTLEISSNTFSGCNYGIDLVNASATGVDQNIVIEQNTFSNNTYGLAIDYGTFPAATDNWEPGDFTVKYNDFSGNTTYGVYNNVAATLTAEYNYWGKATGAYHATTNPGVSGYRGDTVSNNVDYDPWLYLTTTANDGDTVANIVANEVPAYALPRPLIAGWNTFSAPIGLDGQYNTWAELYTLTHLDYSMAYRFDTASQTFVSLGTTSGYAIKPGEGFYIKMDSAGSVPFCASTLFSMPSRDLNDGWNFIGGGMTARSEVDSCISIATAGSTAGYTHIISPSGNQNSWVYIAGAASANNFDVGEGYWVFLPIDRTLGLFDPTPLGWVAP